jgi:hypothetical protein
MKKLVIVLAGAASLVAATATIAAATVTTTADVQTAATAEAHVVSLLHSYVNTPAWKAQYKAAVATQVADLAKVSADVFPPSSSGALTWTTSGTLDTSTFVVHGTFTLRWVVTVGSGLPCSDVITVASIYTAGTNVNSGLPVAGPFDQTGCKPFTTQGVQIPWSDSQAALGMTPLA